MKSTSNNSTLKAALYIRVSTEEQATEGYSVAGQKEKLLAFCKSQDWQVYNTYIDEGYSAKNLNRPSIQKLTQDAENKCFDVVVFYKLDRVSRSLKDLTCLIDRFEKVDIKIKSLTEPFDTTSPPGKLMLNMLGSFAQFEREIIGERTRLGLHRAFKQGKWVTTPPFGYKVVDGKLIIDETNIVLVKKIFELFLKKNMGIKAIVEFLNKEDKISSRKGKWAKNSVWKILKNPVYCGCAAWRNKIMKRNHKPIISQETYEEVQKRLAEKNKTPPHANTSPNFLLGLLKCHKCGAKLKPAKGKQYRYYACTGRAKGCDLPYIPREKVEKAVIKEIQKVSQNQKVIKDSLQKLRDKTAAETKNIKKECELLKQQAEKLIKIRDKKIKWLSDTLPDKKTTNRMSKEINDTDKKIQEVQSKISQQEAMLKDKEMNNIHSETISLFLENFRYYFPEWTTAQRRLLIESIINEIIVYNRERAKIIFSLPISFFKNNPLIKEKENSSHDAASIGEVPFFVPSGVGDGI